MRPEILNYLFSDIAELPGVGEKTREALFRLCGSRVIDLILHFPVAIIDRTFMPDLISAPSGKVMTAVVEIEEHLPPRNSRQPYKVICRNETGYITLVFFNPNKKYVNAALPIGQKRAISGHAERFDGYLQMAHPDYIMKAESIGQIKRIEPVYPLTYGISNKLVAKVIREALMKIPDLPEWAEENFLKKHGWTNWKTALVSAHYPKTLSDVEISAKARQRMAYDEMLANQLALALSRKSVKKQIGQEIKGDGRFNAIIKDSLPFELTSGQMEVIKEIFADMAGKARMIRLLQGDVGSGKTIVALFSMVNAVECGKQAAIMAPTDILARQHLATMQKIIKNAGLEKEIKITLLTGRDKGKNREEITAMIENGEANIIIGTHALFQEGVKFNNLALVVIDEQHRFGVKQRLLLSGKGYNTDVLLMTATPIPRTLTMTLYGDMEISALKEKPANRTPIDTRIIPAARESEIIEGLKRAIKEGNRTYWVCPLIHESEESELAAAEERFKNLKTHFGDRVALIHGEIKQEQRDKTMLAFKAGEIDVLVATTVIEVGVDVPEATIMVIEHAERFGLSQLHQLRGRVGRGLAKSSCILLYGNHLGETGKRRLTILRETEDGFRIAEEDLVLRGSGNVLGTKQSGMPDFRVAVLPEQSELLFAARDDVKIIINSDAELNTPRGKNLRTLLYLFEYDSQVKFLGG